jgi:hypothetical protein
VNALVRIHNRFGQIQDRLHAEQQLSFRSALIRWAGAAGVIGGIALAAA